MFDTNHTIMEQTEKLQTFVTLVEQMAIKNKNKNKDPFDVHQAEILLEETQVARRCLRGIFFYLSENSNES